MKKRLTALILAAVMICSTTVTASAREKRFSSWKLRGRYYAQITRVTRIRRRVDCDVVRIMNANGQLYNFYTYRGDFEVGDCVAVIMDTRGTEYVMDDWVVAAKYDRPDLLR